MSKSFDSKIQDLMLRAKATPIKRDPVIGTVADVAADQEQEFVDSAADGFTYGSVDTRGIQPGEKRVKVLQGQNLVDILYNPATRNARPICKPL